MAVLTSVKSGYWSDPSTWNLGRTPQAGDQVVISSGHTVTYDVVEGSSLDVELGTSGTSTDVDIYGTLQFDPDATQPLRLRYKGVIRIRETGKLICGTNDNPMPVKVTIWKTTSGAPMIYFYNNAELSLVGSPNVPYDAQEGWYRYITKLAASAASGATQITVEDDLNWQVGDAIWMPRLPAAETPLTVTNPHYAFVTAVNGNTLTLSAGLPHDYPAGIEVAKINRSITLKTAATGQYIISRVGSNDVLTITGFKWVWVDAPSSVAYWVYFATFHSDIEYTTFVSNYSAYPTLSQASSSVKIRHHVGNSFQFSNIIAEHFGGITGGQFFLAGNYQPAVWENARVWDLFAYGNQSSKVLFKNCQAFVVAVRQSLLYQFEGCDIYGFTYITGYGVPYLARVIANRCRFYNYSHLGFSTTWKNRFDWGLAGGLALWDFVDCEFFGTWVEPSVFSDPFGHDIPKVRFINKKVGDTLIPYQEFQAGGICTTDTSLVPLEGGLPYTLKFEPKNPNLPFVYQFSLNEANNAVEIWSYVDTSQASIPSDRRVEIIPVAYNLVVDPWLDEYPRLGYASIPAADRQWRRILVYAPYSWESINGRVLVRGSSGAIWLGWRSKRMNLSLINPYLVVDASANSVYTWVGDMQIYLPAIPLNQPMDIYCQFVNLSTNVVAAQLRLRQFGSTSPITIISGQSSGDIWVFPITDSVLSLLAQKVYYAGEFILMLADNSTVTLPAPPLTFFLQA